ncbi:hypothetical protein GCM10023063_20150 [Arthrobacter methylotrophus]|uniref:Type IV pilin n=1 Tax=Arthrobacter methylotrophus TaxID=121291 RepID=A0ABV5UXL2_9MICC
MKRGTRLLRSQRGDMLLDSMAGVVIIVIILFAAVGIIVAAAIASVGSSHSTARSILLNSTLSDQKPALSSFTAAPSTVNGSVQGKNVPVTLWREDTPGGTVILHGAVPRNADVADTACADPTHLDPDQCLTSQTSATTVKAGVALTLVPLQPGDAGAMYKLTVPAGQTELRYVFKVTAVTADSKLSIINSDHPEVSFDVSIPSGQAGYYYGRILTDAGSHLSLSSTGPATFDPASFTIYEAPK